MVLALSMVLLMPSANAQQPVAIKFFRGVVNVISAPIEVPKQARAYWIKGAVKTPHIIAWIASGAVWGGVQGIKRFSYGIWDILNAPFARQDNIGPLFRPEYVYQEWPINPKSGR